MQSLFGRQPVVRAVGGIQIRCVKSHRVTEAGAATDSHGIPVTLDDGNQRLERKLTCGAIRTLVDYLGRVRDRSGSCSRPALHFRILLRDLLAEEADGAQVLRGPSIYRRRHEPLGGITQHDEFGSALKRQRTEKTRCGVADSIEFLGRDLVAIDVGYAGVIAAAVEVAPVPREYEALGHGRTHRKTV